MFLMKTLRRAALVACVTFACVLADDSAEGTVSTGEGSAATAPDLRTCSATLSDASPPVAEPLAAIIGPEIVTLVTKFILETPFGKVLAPPEASQCIANMDGEVLGKTLAEGMQTPLCQSMGKILKVPFIEQAAGALMNGTEIGLEEMLQGMAAITNDDVEQFCSVYVDDLVPCISSQLLPSLVVVRAKYSNGCCDDWVDVTLRNYGYTISGQMTKIAQLFGDFMCATQKPAPSLEEGSSQRCGSTMLQNMLKEPNSLSVAAAVLRMLQVPTDQMCLSAEGQAYVDMNNNGIPAAKDGDVTVSGCAVAEDRAASWIYNLPLAKRSEDFDVRALFEDDKCLKGSELLPLTQNLFPTLPLDALAAYFGSSCVHMPMKFADACTFSRPATLVAWDTEPTQVKDSGAGTATRASSDSDSAVTNSVDDETPEPSAAVSARMDAASGAVVLAASALALRW